MSTPIKHRDRNHKKSDKDRKRKHLADPSPRTSKKARTTTSSSSSKHHNNAPSSPSAAAAAVATDSPANKTPYHEIRASLYLTLSPKYSYKTPHTTPLSGIQKDHLDPLLMSYFEPVNGVVLAYRNISFESDCARIVGESPFAHVWVSVEFLVWRPVKGMLLKGWVNMAGASHVGLLVENTWNVAIPRERIPEGWTWVEGGMGVDGEAADVGEGGEGVGVDEGYWVDGNGKKVEAFRNFKVEAVKAMGHKVSMEGSLLGVEKRRRKPRKERAG